MVKPEKQEVPVEVDFNILPEGCISSILSLTTPRDACRSSVVSPVFKSAAESDALWEKFLPSDYQEIISRSYSPFSSSSSSTVVNFSSKKELYCRLSDNPLLIDDGNKSFVLEKWSGKKCFMLGAKDLTIIWGDTPEYWRWRDFPGSRFAEVAELLSVCWLEIRGKLETRLLSPKTLYAAYLVFKFVENAYGFDDGCPPVDAVVKVVNNGGGGSINVGSAAEKSLYLDPDDSSLRQQLQVDPPHHIEGQFPQERGDGWMESEMGHFFNDTEEDGGEVEMTLREVNSCHWKSGLVVEGIELRPKVNEKSV